MPTIKYWLDGYAGGNANTDWYDVIYREWTSSQEHNLSFSGGNDKVNYYISGNFMDQKGLMEFNQDTYKTLYRYRKNQCTTD